MATVLNSISMAGALSIFLSMGLYPSLASGSGRLILFIAISDFGNSCCGFLRMPESDALCYAQSVAFNYFGLTTTTTSIFISRAVYILFYHENSHNVIKRIINLPIVLAIWGLPAVLCIIPAAFNSYGRDHSSKFCWIRDDVSNVKRIAMVMALFYIPLWTSMVYAVAVYVAVSSRIKAMLLPNTVEPEPVRMSNAFKTIRVVVQQLMWFPAVLLLCYCFPSIFRIASFVGYQRKWLTEAFKTAYFHGFLNAVVFYSLPNVQRKWGDSLYRKLMSLAQLLNAESFTVASGEKQKGPCEVYPGNVCFNSDFTI